MRNLILLALLAVLLTACGATTADGKAIYFQDDFSDVESGWTRSMDADGVSDYARDGYRILVETPSMSFMTTIEHGDPTDVSIEADAIKIGGSEINEFGLICRYSLVDTFYAGVVTSDGYYAIIEKDLISEQMHILGADDFQPTTFMNAEGNNHLRLDCVGDRISLYLNGEFLTEVTDDTQTSGYSGFYVGTYEDGGTDILFDNFVVHEP